MELAQECQNGETPFDFKSLLSHMLNISLKQKVRYNGFIRLEVTELSIDQVCKLYWTDNKLISEHYKMYNDDTFE